MIVVPENHNGGGAVVSPAPGSRTGAGGMPPSLPAAVPLKQVAFLEAENDELAAPENPALALPPSPPLDAATVGALQQTRTKFFEIRDAGAANRREQGQLLLQAQAQLAKVRQWHLHRYAADPTPGRIRV